MSRVFDDRRAGSCGWFVLMAAAGLRHQPQSMEEEWLHRLRLIALGGGLLLNDRDGRHGWCVMMSRKSTWKLMDFC
jgi:hypothetical protein